MEGRLYAPLFLFCWSLGTPQFFSNQHSKWVGQFLILIWSAWNLKKFSSSGNIFCIHPPPWPSMNQAGRNTSHWIISLSQNSCVVCFCTNRQSINRFYWSYLNMNKGKRDFQKNYITVHACKNIQENWILKQICAVDDDIKRWRKHLFVTHTSLPLSTRKLREQQQQHHQL